MAGRPPGLRSIVSALAKLSPTEIKRLISSAPHLDRVARLERQRDEHVKAIKKLDRQIAKLSGGNGSDAPPTRKRRRRKMSAETRRKMSEAAKRRYAGKSASNGSGKKRRTMSPETRAKMAEAAKRRWAKLKSSDATAKS